MYDLFAAEPLILERLRQQMTAPRLVQGMRDREAVYTRTAVAPALYLVCDGQETRMGAGNEQVVDQAWLVVLAVRNARESDTGRAEREEAGPLLGDLARALLGWRPGPDHGPLRMAAAPGPVFGQGMAFFAMRFVTRLLLRGDGGGGA
ncbi:MAG: DUF1834 domain-containing protein [Magnetococcales bacterium]|nr:DUF1834 domain-containing protein [Magnetococcales bacterium]